MKESLFAILRDETVDANVLDLYAGSGALGIEALSRGARRVDFVDRHTRSIAAIRANVRSLGVPADAASITKATAASFLGRLASGGDVYDLVFLDPPYDADLDSVFAPLVALADSLLASAVLVLEHASRTDVAEAYGSFKREREQRYGDTTLSFFRVHSGLPG